MIEYIQVRSQNDREIIGIIDGAKSVIWHTVYYGVGDFEIYAQATESHLELLKEGNYVTRPDSTEVGVIERVSSQTTVSDGAMLVASGRFAKSILDRRHIYKLSGKTNTPTILSGNVEIAVRKLVLDNAVSCSFDSRRNISFLKLGALKGLTPVIVDEQGNSARKQVSYENLLSYTEEVLQEYRLGAIVLLDEANDLRYNVYQGADRSVDNTDGNEPVIFSKEYDNLTESEYTYDKSTEKTAALIGGAGEELDRFYSLLAGSETGFSRRETWVDASSLNKTYKADGSDEEQEYSDAEYRSMLNALGKQQLATERAQESFSAGVNVNGGVWHLNEDYFLGDIVTFQDNNLGKYANVRITEVTEIQDENGYSIEPVFDFESGEPEVALLLLSTENYVPLATENGAALQPERTMLSSSAPGSGGIGGIQTVRISELPASTDVYDGCCLPIVTNGETKKLTYALLKERLAEDIGGGFPEGGSVGDMLVKGQTDVEWESKGALTNQEIENLINAMA